ncbi:heavy metal sensor histidine kinase [Klebsiella pneumoniae]|uniref:heavy metal sensor histidine kinase n=2 Tax=Enterobacteriaceae TaxID=543 RepID=UPI001157D3E2|nr:heavy metal sensor histidine kinase [Klebsiella pneumoniae]ELY2785151.1 heavy metal sensor histidine kinase [Cronobacter turicensis]MCU8675165.1 heavy metal sensor histidine kinase [Klebsiella pneumoniae]MCU8688524.1 heavy metal sensor histidine kinase [Klebsiella pneumoniae]HBR3463624.1 heavy metal sensor histidine kinase [Klebsiella pneumoniae]HCB0101324.1 heavy metal sensor histidine kinase [Klebsiella pneumoniae]
MKIAIATRMSFMFGLTMTLLTLALAVVMWCSLYSSLLNQMSKELHFRHSLIEPFLASKGTVENWSDVKDKLNIMSASDSGYVKHWILSDIPAYRIGDASPAVALTDGFSTAPNPHGDDPFYMLTSTLPPLGNRPAIRYVVAVDSTPYMATLFEFTRMLALISLLAISAAAMLGYLIARSGMRPVRSLSQQAHTMMPGNEGQRLDSAALPAELQHLADAFNGMLSRQEAAWSQLESFNSDVAHELRTPLTNLIGQTQLGLSRKRSVNELEELLQSNLEELARMTSIVNDMLFLSHAQAGHHTTELSEVSLREESSKTAEYVEPSFLENNLTLEIHGEVEACIDRRLFHRALANLLENSARHALPGSTVIIELQELNGQAHIAVTNRGETIPPEHQARLFERFYRVDSSRVRSDIYHGLGLAIVRAIALMHRGDVFVKSENGRNTFGFSLIHRPQPHKIDL